MANSWTSRSGVWIEVTDHPPAMEDRDPVRDARELVEVVARHEDRAPVLAGSVHDQPTDGQHARGIEPVGRLVEHERRGSCTSAAARPSRCRLPSDSPPARRVSRSTIPSAVAAWATARGTSARGTPQECGRAQVLLDRELGIGSRHVDEVADHRERPVDLTRVRAQDAGEHAQQGRLARAVQPDEGVHLPCRDVEVDTVDGRDRAVPADYPPGLERCHGRGPSTSRAVERASASMGPSASCCVAPQCIRPEVMAPSTAPTDASATDRSTSCATSTVTTASCVRAMFSQIRARNAGTPVASRSRRRDSSSNSADRSAASVLRSPSRTRSSEVPRLGGDRLSEHRVVRVVEDDVLLGREVTEERHVRHARCGRDLCDCRTVVAALFEQAHRVPPGSGGGWRARGDDRGSVSGISQCY